MTLLLACILVALLTLSAFFSSAEVAFFSLDAQTIDRLRRAPDRRGRKVASLLAKPTRLLSTILIGNTLVNVALPTVGLLLALRLDPTNAEAWSIILSTLFLLLLGEFIPKRIAVHNPEAVALRYASFTALWMRLLTVLRWGVEAITDRMQRVFRPRGKQMSEEEYRMLVDLGEETGALDEHEHAMVQAIIRLERHTAGDIMIPRVDLLGLDINEGLESDEPEALQLLDQLARKSRVRYLVLYRGGVDDLVGLLDVRTYLLDPDRTWRSALCDPFYVPELATLDKLLPQFLAEGHRIAIAVDEYGGTAGLITRGDVLEEITGEMGDAPHGGHACEALTEAAWLVDANINLEELTRRTGITLHSEASDRLAGWVVEQAGDIPAMNQIVTGDGYRAMVRGKRRNRITSVLLEPEEECEEL